jgi:hypothetical protein
LEDRNSNKNNGTHEDTTTARRGEAGGEVVLHRYPLEIYLGVIKWMKLDCVKNTINQSINQSTVCTIEAHVFDVDVAAPPLPLG